MLTPILAVLTTPMAFAAPPPDDDVQEPPALPANCITELGAPPPEPPARWHDLLPTLSLGLELWPDRRGRFDHDTATDALGATHQHRVDERTRWTVELRWQSSRRSVDNTLEQAEPPPLAASCAELADYLEQRPDDLREALEQWTEVARLQALIDAPRRQGGRQ